MTKIELAERNKKLAIEVQTSIDLLTTIDLLPGNRRHDALVWQLIKCSTSIGTNYGMRSTKSTRAFLNKLRDQEIDKKKTGKKLNVLLTKADQLLSKYAPSRKRLKENKIV
jgi:hypothetical protein